MLDGVYRRGTDGAPEFVEVPAPTDEALQTVLHEIITRTMKLLTRRGGLVEEQSQTYMADSDGDSDEARALRPLQAAACTYRIAFGPCAGQKVLTMQGAMPKESDFNQPLCADIDGFSLHAAVCCGADERQALEQAPNAKLRALVVPKGPEPPAQATQPAECEAKCAHHRPVRLSWARLLKKVLELDLEHCPNCGSELKIIAAIVEQPVIEKILTHLGMQARASPRSGARGQALQAA